MHLSNAFFSKKKSVKNSQFHTNYFRAEKYRKYLYYQYFFRYRYFFQNHSQFSDHNRLIKTL